MAKVKRPTLTSENITGDRWTDLMRDLRLTHHGDELALVKKKKKRD